MRHGSCFQPPPFPHHAATAPHSAVSELGVVRRCSRIHTMNIETVQPTENKALEHFKDWSNVLLATTAAGVGWLAEQKQPDWNSDFFATVRHASHIFALWSFAASALFGIFTLALIPLVAEQQRQQNAASFYDVVASFQFLGHDTFYGCKCELRIKQVCFPQHVLFIAGLLLYALSATQ